ncbi:MAG: cyclic nucleotide-binding domain-containing protein [Leptospirales bacterium]|nr:cyclic nucleotide-binding domain-containing protein [Leptospirales bacterium]
MPDKPYSLLTPTDWDKLLADSEEKPFNRNDMIVQEGSKQQFVYRIQEGYVRIARNQNGQDIVFSRLGPEDLFGEMSFLEDGIASASVFADSDVRVRAIQTRRLESLIASDSSFATRLFYSLSNSLSGRLRELTTSMQTLNVNDIVQVNRFHSTRLGNITLRQIPEALIDSLQYFDSGMRELMKRSRKAESTPDLNQQVSALCAGIVQNLRRYTDEDALVEIGFDDITANRDPEQLQTGIGAFVFRETFRWFMLSETIAHCYMKPRGFSDDHATNRMIQANRPHGDMDLGEAIDTWFLNTPFARSRRAGRALLSQILLNKLQQQTEPRILCLASGAAPEAFDYLQSAVTRPELTLVDIDQEALAAAARLSKKLQTSHSVSLVNQNAMTMMVNRGRYSLEPLNIIYSAGLLDYLEDDEVTTMLNWMHTRLSGGGIGIVSITNPDHYDRPFLKHILEWSMHCRSRDQLALLVERSPFQNRVEWQADPDGVVEYAILAR